MAYIGQTPQIGNFTKIDDISAGFNGTNSTFTTAVSGIAYTVSNPYASLVVALGNVLQPKIDYNFAGTTIVFSSPPPTTWIGSFWITTFGDVLNTGTVSDGTITNAKLAGNISYDKFSSTTKATILSNSLLFGA
jgi:hypothetical protein